jgi:hypothetical protein
MLKPRRKHRLDEFKGREKTIAAILLGAFFTAGMALSVREGAGYSAAYIILWLASYFVLFAGACRKCVYYGKRCPVPLEGACVHRFFGKPAKGFGFSALTFASAAYLLRVAVPVYIIIRGAYYREGLVFLAVFLLFWLAHLYWTACPHCVNAACPLNPDYRG